MRKILVLYYSRTGNTEKMAKAVAEGARSAGNAQVELSYFVEADDLGGFDAVLVGTPTYHHDMPIDIKMLFEEAAARSVQLQGKPAATFGSFGWSGEAPKLVVEIMKNKFQMEVAKAPLLSKYAPDAAAIDECKLLGRQVAESLNR
jgi:flavorubredoxin